MEYVVRVLLYNKKGYKLEQSGTTGKQSSGFLCFWGLFASFWMSPHNKQKTILEIKKVKCLKAFHWTPDNVT